MTGVRGSVDGEWIQVVKSDVEDSESQLDKCKLYAGAETVSEI